MAEGRYKATRASGEGLVEPRRFKPAHRMPGAGTDAVKVDFGRIVSGSNHAQVKAALVVINADIEDPLRRHLQVLPVEVA